MLSITRNRRLLALPLLAALAMLFIAACSDDDDGGDSGATETLAPTGAPTPDGDDDTASDSLEVTIAGFAFSPNEYRVLAGETVTFTITNSDGVTHNMHIATNVVPDGEALAGDYTGSRCDGAVDPCSDPPAISGGEAAVLEWAVPQETGAVRFRCDFHPTSMVGKIIIE